MTVIDDYLQTLSGPERQALQAIRDLVHGLVQDVDEVISYGIPTFKYKKRNLLHMSAFKDHLSIFPGVEVITLLAEEFKDFKTSKGTVQFTIEHPIPKKDLERVIRLRVAAIDKK